MSDNGRKLAEMRQRNNLILLNTVFKHKMAHRTTWTSPKQPKTPRRNLYRNQIDFILIRKQHLCLATNARSYGGTTTTSDHKLVKTNFNIKWHEIKFNKQTASPDHTQLRNPAIKFAYTEKVKEHLINKRKENETPQEKWTRICDACHQAAKEIIPKPMKNGRKNNEEIEKLSKQQQKLKNDLESTKNSKEQHKIKKERQKIHREIRSILRTEEDNRTSEKLEEIEKQKDDARKMFHDIKDLQKQTTPKTLLINGENGLTPNPKQQIKIITTHFQDQFHKDADKLQEISPTEMKNQFTTEEVERALKKLKYNKSPGIDEIRAEHLRYGPPEELAEIIKQILNETAKTGAYPEEMKIGILTPLQKPGKKQGPPSNLRPIIPLSLKDSSNNNDQKNNWKSPTIYTQDPSSISIWKEYH